jgi:site-specific DNA-methyltransferase (adenine-specific)
MARKVRVEKIARGVTLYCGDCLELLPTLGQASVDAIVTDPPYGLGFMGKAWDSGKSFVERKQGTDRCGNHNPTCSADAARTRKVENRHFGEWCESWARECLRVLKPGGHLLAFGGSRTYHRLACAIEDAGFEIRDQIMWIYGQGFPKSLDVSKAIDKAAGEWRGRAGKIIERTVDQVAKGTEYERTEKGAPATDAARKWQGFGTALKPAHEPIVLARKPLIGTVAANVLAHGTGALNIDGCRVGTTKNVPASASKTPNNIYGAGMTSLSGGTENSGFDPNIGRWPANIILDGSDEVVGAFPDGTGGGSTTPRSPRREGSGWDRPANHSHHGAKQNYDGVGSAARFFYSAKASKKERRGSKHPTVKPLALMRYLVRLITPPGGIVLDCFAGSGTTGEAARAEGFKAILIEQQREYQRDIQRRISEALKAKGRKVAA